MYLKILLGYILGYINIIVEGYFVEKFLNICNKEKIFLWNLKRKETTIIHANIGIKDFKRIKQIAKKTKSKIKITYKRGLPFIFNKYKKRKLFALGLFIVIFMLLILSKFIWNIEVIGNTNIDALEIAKMAEENGLKVGMLKSKINTKHIIDNIRLKRNDLAWVGIDIKGTNAVIELVEATPKPKIINEDEYCNIVATKDAIITKVNAQNGTPVVTAETKVKKGDILIAGEIEGKYTGNRYAHATGDVYGRTWYTNTQKIYFNQQKIQQTGNSENKYSVNINNFKINFNKGVSKFENYDTIEMKKKLKIFSHFYLPIEIVKKTNKEVNVFNISLSEEEAKSLGYDMAKEEIEKQIDNEADILNIQTNINSTPEYIEVEVIYEVVENIGTEEKIII